MRSNSGGGGRRLSDQIHGQGEGDCAKFLYMDVSAPVTRTTPWATLSIRVHIKLGIALNGQSRACLFQTACTLFKLFTSQSHRGHPLETTPVASELDPLCPDAHEDTQPPICNECRAQTYVSYIELLLSSLSISQSPYPPRREPGTVSQSPAEAPRV